MAQRQQKTAARRQRILEAALAVFSEKSLGAATMDDIRSRAEASTGSIYHHFQGKEHLIAELYLDGARSLHAAVREALAGASNTASGLGALVDSYLGWFEDNAELGRFMLQAASTNYVSDASATIAAETASMERLVLDWLEPLVRAGALVNLSENAYMPLIIGPCREIIRRWLAGRVRLAEVRQPLAAAIERSLRSDTHEQEGSIE